MRFLFLHGGPGFNSFAEQAILAPVVQAGGHSIRFWNEPSRLRPEGDPFEPERAFEGWLASAERFVLGGTESGPAHLVSHSCSIHPALEIARRHAPRIASLVLVSPAADVFATFTNVMRLAHDDLAEAKPGIASAIAGCLERTGAVLDDAMREGLLNVLHDDRLFTHYWSDAEQFRASVAAQARPEAQFDVESFFAVLGDFAGRGADLLSRDAITCPALAIFGADDRVTRHAEQRQAVLAAVPHARIDVFDGCSHYLHLDRPEAFLDTVVSWASSTAL